MVRSASEDRGRAGFSLVEVIVAIMILSVGLLALAGSTAFVIRTVTVSDLNTQRAAALQSTVETLRSQPFNSVVSGSDTIGPFEVSWVVSSNGPNVRTIEVVTSGPGMQASTAGGMPVISNEAVDTFRTIITRR